MQGLRRTTCFTAQTTGLYAAKFKSTIVKLLNQTLDLFDDGDVEDKWHQLAFDQTVDVSINEGFLNGADSNNYFDAVSLLDFSQESIQIFGRIHRIPRLTASFGDPGTKYSYSGIQSETQPFPSFLAGLRDKVQVATGCRFNFVLINLYRNGLDKVGWHSDDEPDLGSQIDVASLSFGAARRFKMRHKLHRDRQITTPLRHGSLLLMRHPTQRHWEHCVPAEKNVDERRANLTFRNAVPCASTRARCPTINC